MKPKVICHIMASVDGHIQVERWTDPADGVAKGDLMKAYSEIGQTLYTDAWTFGKNTVRDIFLTRPASSPLETRRLKRIRPLAKRAY